MRERGLKLYTRPIKITCPWSLPMRERGLKSSNRLMIDYWDRMEWAERGYIAGCMNSLAAFAAMDALGYSVKRVQNLFGNSMKLIEKAGDLDMTTWPDIIAGWLEGENIQFTGYWITPDEGSPLPNLTEEQLHKKSNRWKAGRRKL